MSSKSFKVILSVLLLLTLFFCGKYFYLVQSINNTDVDLYNDWINSLDNAKEYLDKALDQDVGESNDYIKSIRMYFRAQGLSKGIFNSSLREFLLTIEGQRLNPKVDLILQTSPELERIKDFRDELEMLLKKLPLKINNLKEIKEVM